MAVIKCSNCENEILDSEIVCPYCDHPVNSSLNDEKDASGGDSVTTLNKENKKSKTDIKIASVLTFEKEKSELLKKLEESESTESQSDSSAPDESSPEKTNDTTVTDKTVRISKDDMNAGLSKEEAKPATGESTKNIKEAAAKIKINTPTTATGKPIKKKKTSGEINNKVLIIILTAIGIIIAVSLICKDIPADWNKAEEKTAPRKNKSAKVDTKNRANKGNMVLSDGTEIESDDLPFTIIASATMEIQNEALMKDYTKENPAPWATKENKEKIRHITIHDCEDVTKIGDYAFYGFTALEKVTIGSAKNNIITEIGESAFEGCTALKTVTAEVKLQTIGERAFYGCENLTNFTTSENFTSIEDDAFTGCISLNNFPLPDDVEINGNPFKDCEKLVIACSKNSQTASFANKNGIQISHINSGSDNEELNTESEDNTGNSENTEITNNTNTAPSTSQQNTQPSSGQSNETQDGSSQTSDENTQDYSKINEIANELKNPDLTSDQRADLEKQYAEELGKFE